MKPKVSVITPTFNRCEHLPGVVENVQAQDFQDWEMVIVDDGSSDATQEVLREISSREPRVRHVRQENGGVSAARNTALANARGEYVAMLDDDDRWFQGKLSGDVAALDAHPEAALVFSDGTAFEDDRVISESLFQRGHPAVRAWIERHRVPGTDRSAGPLFDVLCEINCVLIGTVTMRRAALEKLPYAFDGNLRGGEGFDLWMRLLRDFPAVLRDARTLKRIRHSEGLCGAKDVRGFRHREWDAVTWHRHFKWMPEAKRSKAGAKIAENARIVAWHCLGSGDKGKLREMCLLSLRYRPLQPKVWAYLAAGLISGDSPKRDRLCML